MGDEELEREILRRLDKLETAIQQNSAAVNQMGLKVQEQTLKVHHHYALNEMLGEQVDGLKTAVYGCAENNVLGHTTRMDRLEQTQRSWRANFWALWAVFVGLLINILKDMFNFRG